MNARLATGLSLLASLVVAAPAYSQVQCTPWKGCTVTVQPPPVSAQGQAQGQGSASAPSGQTAWQAELARRAQWKAYFDWRAQVWAEAQASIDARVYLDGMKQQARLVPDRYASMASPAYAAPGDATVSFPRVDIGFLGFCVGEYSGSGGAMYVGYCPAFRYRFDPNWALEMDPAVVQGKYAGHGFAMLGLHPGVEYGFAVGKRGLAASHLYTVGGLDLWFPVSNTDITPTAFLGGHLGLGATLSGETWGIGFEVRGLVRGGLGDGGNTLARSMSTFRVGFEIRAPVIYVSF
jgi:hypothetical protein